MAAEAVRIILILISFVALLVAMFEPAFLPPYHKTHPIITSLIIFEGFAIIAIAITVKAFAERLYVDYDVTVDRFGAVVMLVVMGLIISLGATGLLDRI